jgi:hypothetical protein
MDGQRAERMKKSGPRGAGLPGRNGSLFHGTLSTSKTQGHEASLPALRAQLLKVFLEAD